MKPPTFLKGSARAEWMRLVPLLTECGLATELDRAALATICTAWGRIVECEKKIHDHGLMILSPKKHPIPSPYLAIANKAREEMMRALCEFGMTPSSRTKIEATPTPEMSSSDAASNARFFGRT